MLVSLCDRMILNPSVSFSFLFFEKKEVKCIFRNVAAAPPIWSSLCSARTLSFWIPFLHQGHELMLLFMLTRIHIVSRRSLIIDHLFHFPWFLSLRFFFRSWSFFIFCSVRSSSYL